MSDVSGTPSLARLGMRHGCTSRYRDVKKPGVWTLTVVHPVAVAIVGISVSIRKVCPTNAGG
jgi:hypothetical protein